MHTLPIRLLAVFVLAAPACKSSGSTAVPNSTTTDPQGGSSASGSPDSNAVDWNAPVVVATGDARRGPWRMNESKFYYVDDPSVASTNDGDAVVWVDNRRMDVFFQRYSDVGAPGLDEPTNVSKSPDTFSWLPRVVTSPDGESVFALWQEIIFSGGTHGGETLFARSTDGGRTFHPPLNLSNTTAGCGKGRLTTDRWHNGSLDLARMDDGPLVAAWTEYQGPLRVARTTDGGKSFSAPVHVAGTAEDPARGPALATRGDTVYLAWAVGEDDTGDIHIARSTDGGRTFEEPRIVHDTAHHSDAPSLAVASNGTLHLVYGESTGGMFAPDRVVHATRPADGEFGEAKLISGDHHASFPSVAVDSRDRAHVIWEHFSAPDARPHGLRYTVSTDDGESFRESELVAGTTEVGQLNGSLQGLLMDKLAVDDDGSISVVNSSFAPNERSVVHLIRGRLR